MAFEIVTTINDYGYTKENCQEICEDKNMTFNKTIGRICRCGYNFSIEGYIEN